MSRSIWSRNSFTSGRMSSLAMRRPPIIVGLTTAVAPAFIIFGAASVLGDLAMMRALAFRLRALSVTKRLSLSCVSAATTPRARSTPASRSA